MACTKIKPGFSKEDKVNTSKKAPITRKPPIEPRKERTTSTFLDAYNNNKVKSDPYPPEDMPEVDTGQQQQTPQETPMVTWETSGEGKKIPIVIFNCGALSKPQPQSVGQKYHLTFKTVNADAKLISQVQWIEVQPNNVHINPTVFFSVVIQ